MKTKWISTGGRLHNLSLFICIMVLSFQVTTARALAATTSGVPIPSPSAPLVDAFEQTVKLRLMVPSAQTLAYASLLDAALTSSGIADTSQKFVVVVDRNPNVQVLLVYWGTLANGWSLIGASSVSTGLPGKYEHFKTPLGVFDHSRENPDFRAEGTKNAFGVRGYGKKGGRIYDFGWVKAPRGWGDGHMGELRLQMHSTDADLLEKRLGTAQSEGCIRLPAELNEFIDRHGILDDDYDRVVAVRDHPWVLRKDRLATPWSGRYLVVVESDAAIRPDWASRRTQSH